MMKLASNCGFGLVQGVGMAAIALLLLTPAAALAGKVFPTPDAAADAFTAAIGKPEAMAELLGADWQQFIPTEGINDEHVQKYMEGWAKRHEVLPDPFDAESGRMVVAVGEGGWTLPIPLVKSDAGWSFDVQAGAEEMKTRRVGRNELAAISAVYAYVQAQREYALEDRDGDGYLEYAQRIISTPGLEDGLYWAALDDEPDSPLGPLFGEDKPGSDYHGYLFKVLKAQGPAARGGAHDYVVNGNMRGGFALIAWPVEYDDTGVMSFMVNRDGLVYEADLGPETEALARKLEAFDPGGDWKPLDPTEAD